MKKECNYCNAIINTEIDSYFTCQDNFLQVKYFDTEEENIFCCRECFCNYVQLEEIDPFDEDLIVESDEDEK